MKPGQDTHRFDDLPHVVYRCYDADDGLVYIGCTHDLEQRKRHHRQQRPDVVRLTARWEAVNYPDKASARAAERAAIYAEQPPYNRIYRGLANTT